jgi:hypothetical protein
MKISTVFSISTILFLTGILFSAGVFSFTQSVVLPPPAASEKDHGAYRIDTVWSVNAALGYANFSHLYNSDGQTPVGRFAMAVDFFHTDGIRMGLETGIQNGNEGRLSVPQDVLDQIGGAPIQFTIKPILDFLLTFQKTLMSNWFFLLKGGMAYRRSQCFSSSNSDLDQLNGEVQVGLGENVTQRVNLNLLYQGIFAGTPKFIVNMNTMAGYITNIPTQNAVLLELSAVI